MNLRKLEILGFKSFANKTVIDFSKGMTAVVGPNGCGKTNILDALRWVLGEQKVSMLRGSKMEEVIFNGTRDVKPLGMAEVTLTLDNNRGVLPTEYTEIQITRRLFRSGESEYLLNKVPCRLKDINDLFYDTGMGAHSYSVIQQDMIESVISDKAEERRFLFEEAAGITKYKQRKKAALRKLEATENDFLRLNDIYSEVQTQVRSLKRQQNKAERYQIVADQIKSWELYLSSSRIKEIEQERREIKANYDQLKDQLSEQQTTINILTSELESERTGQIELEQALSKSGQEIYDTTEEAHAIETEITILKEKRSNATNLIERNESDIKSSSIRVEMLSDQKNELATTLSADKTANEQIVKDLSEARTQQAEADRSLLEARSSKEDRNKQMLELEGKLSSGKTEEDNLRQQERDFQTDIDKLNDELESNSTTKESLLVERNQKRESFDIAISNKQQAEEKLTEATKQLEQLIEDNENFTSDISNLKSSIEAAHARKNLLEEMILHYEGYESGVKSVMESKDNWTGIFGTVAEKFVPVEGMESAVEAALSEMARFIICDNRKTADNIISYLKSEKKGKVGMLVPDSGTLNPVVKRPDLTGEEFLGWMDTFVTTEDKLNPLKQAVLSRTAVFKSGYSPDRILELLPYGFNAVSTSGELYSKNIVSGGSDEGSLSLFRRQEKVDEQDEIIKKFESELVTVQANKNKTNAEIASIRSEISTLSDKIDSLTEEVAEEQKSFNETEFELRSVDSEIIRLEKEVRTITDKLNAIKHRQYSLSLSFNELSEKKDNLVSTMSTNSEHLQQLEHKASESQSLVSKLQVQLVESRSKTEQTESKINHISELINELQNTIELKTKEIERAKADIESSKDKILELEENLKVKFNLRQELTAKQSELRTQQSEIMERVNAKEKQLREIRNQKDSISDNSHQIDIRLNTLESESQRITERIEEEYSLDIKQVSVENPDSEVERADAQKLLHELKDQLKKFGVVNLLALEEYKAASEREEFLREQLGDLRTAKDDLSSTIATINQTARKLFEETFAQVKINFKNLFTELFTGGEADISLIDPSDPLESDIDIIARPRGKKLLSITMMSGGERALTAISLLFSLYMVKPSPFCILDEIDAPLDDANCKRFLRIIKTFSTQTQFILITHNKITMEAAHNLYGITMEQFGISKLVAVKFSEFEPEADNESGLIIEMTDNKEELKFVRGGEDITSAENEITKEDFDTPSNGNGHGEHSESIDIIEREESSIPESPDELPEPIKNRINENVLQRNDSSEDELE